MLKRFIQTAALGLSLALASTGVQALPIGLGLVLDGSGSINDAEFNLQRNGYISALSSVLPTDGSVAVGVYQFSSPTFGSPVIEFSFQIIANATDKANLLTALSAANMPQLGGGTVIGDGIDAAHTQMAAFGFGNLDKAIIDVSTDGVSSGTPLNNANAFVAAAGVGGIEGNVNCLGIGAGANCNFIAGPNSFAITGVTFAQFEQALVGKLRRELGVPEPGTVLLLGLGLVGLSLRRRLIAA